MRSATPSATSSRALPAGIVYRPQNQPWSGQQLEIYTEDFQQEYTAADDDEETQRADQDEFAARVDEWMKLDVDTLRKRLTELVFELGRQNANSRYERPLHKKAAGPVGVKAHDTIADQDLLYLIL
jgi:hypothetical protein